MDKEQSGAAVREYYLTDDINWLSGRKEQAGLKSIGCVHRRLEKLNGERVEETRYFIAISETWNSLHNRREGIGE